MEVEGVQQTEGQPQSASQDNTDQTPRAPTFACRDLKTFTAVEYPGAVGSSSTSVQAALDSVGGLPQLKRTLASSGSQDEESSSVVELRLAPPTGSQGGVNFEHPIQASHVDTGNLVLKITRRRRKKKNSSSNALDRSQSPLHAEQGIYTVQPAGVVKRTLRFRSWSAQDSTNAMADFQYHPAVPSQTDPDSALDLASAMINMDVDTMCHWKAPPPSEDYSRLRLVPPPLFARLGTAIPYNYKPLAGTVPTTFTNAQGDEITRMINTNRYKGIVYNSASFYDDKPVPDGPIQGTRLPNSEPERVLVDKLKKLMEERPMWSRMALMNQLDAEDARKLYNTPLKGLLGAVSYSFEDGPFRDLLIRHGFDPRTNSEARKYQRIMLRNMGNTDRKKRPPQVVLDNGEERQHVHIFDGQQVYREVGNYQMCDITDPMLSELQQRSLYWLTEAPDERTGWFLPTFFDNFRELLRLKFVCLIAGEPVPEAELQEATERLPSVAEVRAEKRLLASEQQHRGSRVGGVAGGSRSRAAAAANEVNDEVRQSSRIPQAASMRARSDDDDDEEEDEEEEDDIDEGHQNSSEPSTSDEEGTSRVKSGKEHQSLEGSQEDGTSDSAMRTLSTRATSKRVLPQRSRKPKAKKRTAGARG